MPMSYLTSIKGDEAGGTWLRGGNGIPLTPAISHCTALDTCTVSTINNNTYAGAMCGSRGPQDLWLAASTIPGAGILHCTAPDACVTVFPFADSTMGVNAMWASSANDLWAVGKGRGRVIHCSAPSAGACTSITAYTSPDSTNLPVAFSAVWGSGPGDVWAVGSYGLIVHCTSASLCAVVRAPDFLVRPSPHLTSVHGSGPNDVWVVGKSRSLFHCTAPDECAAPSIDCKPMVDFSRLW